MRRQLRLTRSRYRCLRNCHHLLLKSLRTWRRPSCAPTAVVLWKTLRDQAVALPIDVQRALVQSP